MFVTTAVVVGVASPALAATPAVSSPATESVESSRPVLAVTVSDADGGSVTGKFFARTVGAATWNLVNGSNGAAVTSGQRSRYRLPGALRIGQSFEWSAQACDATTCSALTAVQTGKVSQIIGAGARPSGTRLPFNVGDRLGVQVDVGTGNLLVTTTEVTLPGIRRDVAVGMAYNSVSLSSRFAIGFGGYGWRFRAGTDVKLTTNPDASMTYVGPDGWTGLFALKAGSTTTYDSPAGFKADLVKTATGWTLTDHRSSDQSVFTIGGQLDKVIDRNGQVTDFTYTTGGQPTQITSTRGTSAARTLTVTATTGNRVTGLSQTGRSATYGYDTTTGDLTSIVDMKSRTTTFGYDTAHRLTSITNTGGFVTRFTYNVLDQVTTVTQENPAGDSVTRLDYPTLSRTLVADAGTDQSLAVSAVPHTVYDLNVDARVLKATDPGGFARDRTYTAFTDVQTSTQPTGGITTNTYDPAVNGGQSRTSTSTPTGASTSLAYANTAPATRYLPSSGTDAQANASTLTYDGPGNRTAVADASAATAKVTYNPNGTVATSTDPGNGTNDTTYQYANNDGQLTGITAPTGTTLGGRSFTYDGYGRLATDSWRGITTTYAYDTLDRVTSVDYSDSTPTVSYTYTPAGQVHTRVDVTGTTTYGYDPLRRLTSRTAASGGGTLTYTWNKVGNLKTVDDSRTGTTSYTYSARNLLLSMTTAQGTLLNFKHDDDGMRTDTWFATNSGNTTWAAHTHTDYDAASRPKRIWTARNSSDTTRVADVSYCYSPYNGAACPTASATTDSKLIRWTYDNLSSTRTTYTYSSTNRLTGATVTGGTNYSYGYNSNGNRTTASTPNQSLTFNPGNQITTSGYTHDAAGNLTTDPTAGTLSYNGADQMTTATAGTTGYTYAGTNQNELIHQDLSTDVDYVYGRTDQHGLPLIQSIVKGTGTYYLDHDPLGTPLVFTTDSGTENFYALDNLGSPLALINTSSTVTATYTYDPYGIYTTTSSTGSAAAMNPYRYAGGIYDRGGAGWIKYGQRWYNPTTGRFTQQDSLNFVGDPGTGNRYAYAAANPVTLIDPTGKFVGEAGVKLCYYVCVGGGIASGDESGDHPYLSVGVGAPGVGGGYMFGPGQVNQGWSAEGGCSAGFVGAPLVLQEPPEASAPTYQPPRVMYPRSTPSAPTSTKEDWLMERAVYAFVAIIGVTAVLVNRRFAKASKETSRTFFGRNIREGSREDKFMAFYARAIAILVGLAMAVGGTLGALGLAWRQ